MSFAAMKARRGNTNTAKLIEEINKIDPTSRKRVEDDRFWKPTTDKVGNGYAVIRFLPAREEEDLVVPFVAVYDHGFQGPSGKWYIENSLTTLGEVDPVGELNQKLWNSGLESDKEIARKQKRRLHYVTNILVVKDPANPANEGRVFLYKLGPKIYGKIKDAMTPPEAFADEKQIIPYDFWEGANFKLKIRKVEGYTNYDTSSFDDPSPIFEDDEKIEKTYEKLHLLKQFVDPNGKDVNGYPLFKSYDDLKAKLYKVLEIDTAVQPQERQAQRANESAASSSKADDPTPEPEDTSTWTGSAPATDDDGDSGDDTLDYFRKLAQGD